MRISLWPDSESSSPVGESSKHFSLDSCVCQPGQSQVRSITYTSQHTYQWRSCLVSLLQLRTSQKLISAMDQPSQTIEDLILLNTSQCHDLVRVIPNISDPHQHLFLHVLDFTTASLAQSISHLVLVHTCGCCDKAHHTPIPNPHVCSQALLPCPALSSLAVMLTNRSCCLAGEDHSSLTMPSPSPGFWACWI